MTDDRDYSDIMIDVGDDVDDTDDKSDEVTSDEMEMEKQEVNEKLQVVREKLGTRAEENLQSGSGGGDGDSDVPSELKFLERYMTDDSSIKLKGNLPSDKVAIDISAVREYTELFDELEDMDDVFDDWLDGVESRLTSVRGQSRDEFRDILSALLSGVAYKNEDRKSGVGRKLFGMGDENDESEG